ncbi:MAG: HD domain-containing protein [Lachnospiraceae bacterium]|nr:HD domain-containing protein [Lachnospiraceae bacterium]
MKEEEYIKVKPEELYNDFVEFMVDMLVQCKADTREHIWYVARYTEILAETYARLYPKARMTAKKRSIIIQASKIRDIGKLALPDVLLDKAGEMSDMELEYYKKHTIKGSQMILNLSGKIGREYERISYNTCLYHHEKYDGSGYPYGLKGKKVPIEALLVGLADIYDALVNFKGRRATYTNEEAVFLILDGRCGELSPKMRECIIEARDEMEAVKYCE